VRFLKEAATIAGDGRVEEASAMMERSGRMFTKAGMLFKDYEDKSRVAERIAEAGELLKGAADVEERNMKMLADISV